MTSPQTTYFASAEREPLSQVLREYDQLNKSPFLKQIIDSLSIAVAVFNAQRQIVFSNRAFLNLLGNADLTTILGKRPGEALGCTHSNDTINGCGTSETCKMCGAVQAIAECLLGNVKSVKECRIAADGNNGLLSYDLLVTANPFEFEHTTYAIVCLDDISHLKRRRLLEQIFFHDIINSASGLQALVECINVSEPNTVTELLPYLGRQATTILDEILSQKQILEAETGELKPHFAPVHAREISETVIASIAFSPLAQNRKIYLDPLSKDFEILSDFVVLKRILLNMLKNAVESSEESSEITLYFSYLDKECIFEVSNAAYIPRDIQLQLFQRSFSTKGIGRGLGTYSMKLLGEKYLKGAVGFESTEETGTKFFIKLPWQNFIDKK